MKAKHYRSGLLVLSASLLSSTAWAITVTVGPLGDHTTIAAAIAAVSNGDTISVLPGSHTEPPISVNKAVTIAGPNAGVSGAGTRSAEARLVNTPITITAAGAVIDGVEIFQTDAMLDAVLLHAASTVENTIIRRNGAASGVNARGITTAMGLTGVTIAGNLFTGDSSGGFFGGHKTWNSGIYSNGGSATISGNTFENCRTALNLDNFNAGISVTGNSFRTSGTYVSFGGTTPTDGQYTITGNDFFLDFPNIGTNWLPSAVFNNSNVAPTFRIDVTGNTFGGIATGSLTDTQKFAIEQRMNHHGRSGKQGGIEFVAGQQIVVAGFTLQSAVDAATAGDTILIGGNITLTSSVTVNKQLTFEGGDKATTKISGSNALAGYFLLFSGASGSSIVQNISFDKTDKAGVQNMIGLQAPNLTIQDCNFTGQYVLGDPDVSRAFEVSANGFLIQDCSITGLRQPAYINAVTGTVENNYVAGTKGWVVDGGLVTFTGNTWGVGPAANGVDIALLDGTPFSPLYDPLSTLSANNNGASISNQRTSTRVFNLTQSTSFGTIQSAVTAAASGDVIEVYPGTFNESVTIDKDIDLTGDGSNSTIVVSTGTVINISAAGSGATVTGIGVTGGSRGFNLNGVSNVLLDSVSSTGNTSFGINLEGASSAVTLKNSSFSNNGSSGIKVTSSSRVTNLAIDACTVNGNLFGLYAADGNAATYQANAQLDGLTANNGSTFSNNTSKGIYIESMNSGLFDGIEVVNSGQGSTGATSAGIDINLKYANYSNLTIRNSLISGCGKNNSFGGGILVKAQSTGSYSANPATLGGTVLLQGLRVENNGKAGTGAGVRVGDSLADTSPTNVVIQGSTFGGNMKYAVLNLVPSGAITATHNHWSAPAGPIGATSNGVGGNVTFNPWYASSNAATPPVLSNLRSGILQNITINTIEPNVPDLYIAPGTTVTVTPTGSLGATKFELAAGAEINVNEGALAIGDGSVISGSFTVFNSFGSWNINGDTTVTANQSLALISDIHVAGGKTLSVTGTGELILDGCIIDSQSPGTKYNIVADTSGALTMARNVVTDANIDINTLTASVAPNLVSRVYSNSFITSDIEASADAKVYHNLFDANTASASNTDATVAFADVDGWGNVTTEAGLKNRFSLNFAAPVNPTRTLDNGNLFVQPNDPVVMKVDVGLLDGHTITATEALLGYNSNRLTLTGTNPAVTPSTVWQVVIDDDTLVNAPIGMIDSALGLNFVSGDDGIGGPATIANVNFTAGSPGLSLGFFRVQTNGVFNPDGSFDRDTRLTKSLGGTPSFMSPFSENTGELVIDNEAPEILTTPAITGTQIQPSQVLPVDVQNSANPVLRTSDPLVLTFSATDNGHGLSGLDAADYANDLVLTDVGSNSVIPNIYYGVITSETGGVVTYTVNFAIPANQPSGAYSITGTVQDRSGNVSAVTTLGSYTLVDEAQVNVELQGFTGTTRDVTFVATGGLTTATWTKTITNFVAGSGFAILENVPAGTTSISAKSAWTLRSKVAVTTSSPLYTASLTGTNLLKAGDITGDNVVNTLDYSVLRYNWVTANSVSDITGDGQTNGDDYNWMRLNFYTAGSAQ
jgi:hypothetical protein